MYIKTFKLTFRMQTSCILLQDTVSHIVLSLFFVFKAGNKRQQMLKTEETEKGHSEESMLRHDVHGVKFGELPLFKFQMLSDATDKFDSINKLGQGGFGSVYKVFHFIRNFRLTSSC